MPMKAAIKTTKDVFSFMHLNFSQFLPQSSGTIGRAFA
jgi:hypothetical protein